MTQDLPSHADMQLDSASGTLSAAAETSKVAAGLRCIRLEDRYKALGLAANMLSKVNPYANYRSGALISTLMAEIVRGHYVFTLRGDTVLGYAGWALCTPEIARAWVTGQHTPNFNDCLKGSCPVLVTFHSKDRDATRFQIRFLRSLYPGQSVYFRRDYLDGRSRFAKVLNTGSVARQSI